jgi:hypothetical protein
MQFSIQIIGFFLVVLLGCSYLMFWFGQKTGVTEGRRQVLEEDMKRTDQKIKYTNENLMILNLYDTLSIKQGE